MPCTVSAGVHDFFCAAFAEALAPYADIIVAMVAGHTHRDSWVTFTQSNVDLVQYVTPSLTTFSFKVGSAACANQMRALTSVRACLCARAR